MITDSSKILQGLRDFVYDEYDERRYDSSGDRKTIAEARMWASGFIIGCVAGFLLGGFL